MNLPNNFFIWAKTIKEKIEPNFALSALPLIPCHIMGAILLPIKMHFYDSYNSALE